MAVADNSRKPAGFEGGVAGLGLSDLIQLNASNRFSGCFRVRCDDRVGLIFFRDGDVVHAELDGKVGEEAFCEILAWTRGTFDAEPNVVTARRTIQKKCEHLLLDAHRVIDERRARGGGAPEAPQAAPAPKASTVDLVAALPGVSAAVILTRDGQKVGERGGGGETLAGETAYLALMGDELGALFQAGEIRAATVQASSRNVLLYSTRSHYLGVSTEPERDPAAVDAAIRSTLAKR
jgi:predicted regulator of Ras-like GTPase activity (Roadblock/LC7/MglB family)